MIRRHTAARRALVVIAGLALVWSAAACSDDGESAEDVDAGDVEESDTTEGPDADGSDGDGSTTSAPPTESAEPVPSAGCGTSEAAAEVEAERTFDQAGTERRYLLTVPSAHDGTTPLPVVFDFHGLLEGAEVHAGMSQYSALAEEEGFVVVFPHGTGEPLSWNINPDVSPNPDVEYFDMVVEQIGAELCVDESRRYATGLSNGAMFTSVLLCQRADMLAAAAPVAGITDLTGCDPSRPVPIVSFHGTDDPILLFNGGVDLSMIPGSGGAEDGGTTTTRPAADLDGEGYPANVAAFAERNGCEPEPTDTNVTDAVVHRVYDCPAGADVEFYVVLGGGHSWPGSEFSESIGDIVGPTTFDIDATADAWAFMRQFSTAG
jgi:polyhydroxybutyrate depolymerase